MAGIPELGEQVWGRMTFQNLSKKRSGFKSLVRRRMESRRVSQDYVKFRWVLKQQKPNQTEGARGWKG